MLHVTVFRLLLLVFVSDARASPNRHASLPPSPLYPLPRRETREAVVTLQVQQSTVVRRPPLDTQE